MSKHLTKKFLKITLSITVAISAICYNPLSISETQAEEIKTQTLADIKQSVAESIKEAVTACQSSISTDAYKGKCKYILESRRNACIAEIEDHVEHSILVCVSQKLAETDPSQAVCSTSAVPAS